MVKEVKAFAADDGVVFSTHGEAARHDAECKLRAANLFKIETISAIIKNAEIISEALSPLLDDPEEERP